MKKEDMEKAFMELKDAGYRTGERLGAGKFGEVYLVEQMGTGTKYACKIAIGEKNRKLLAQEAVMHRRLTVSGGGSEKAFFPTYHEWIEGSGQSFLVMEYVHGVAISELLHTSHIQQSGSMKLQKQDMLLIALQLAEALRLLHEQIEPVLYRDLKPEHVILDWDESMRGNIQIRLLDLGCACLQSEAWKSTAGSRGYAAPEQLGEIGYGQGTYSDIYSFGKMLQFLLDNLLPDRYPVHPYKFLWHLAAQCTAKDPRKRIPCMRVICQELRLLQHDKRIEISVWEKFVVEKCICETA